MFADWRATSFLKSSGALASPFWREFIVHADEKLAAFRELESAVLACGELS
jgi:hypothetical protein